MSNEIRIIGHSSAIEQSVAQLATGLHAPCSDVSSAWHWSRAKSETNEYNPMRFYVADLRPGTHSPASVAVIAVLHSGFLSAPIPFRYKAAAAAKLSHKADIHEHRTHQPNVQWREWTSSPAVINSRL
jgi:hypothetical protein